LVTFKHGDVLRDINNYYWSNISLSVSPHYKQSQLIMADSTHQHLHQGHPVHTSQSVTMALVCTRIRSTGTHHEATSNGYYRNSAYRFLADRMHRQHCMPPEIVLCIFEAGGHIVWREVPGTRKRKHTIPKDRLAFGVATVPTPPASGSCPFIDKLPAEIRRKILVEELDSLPLQHETVHPACGDQASLVSTRRDTSNHLTTLMLVNKKIRDEIAEIVYEERTFGIHVHQGFRNAGIEFLHVGRQPLQYLDNINDGRFTKFRPGDMFGFCRLKKIEIAIFPNDGVFHHTAINTYFMNLALVRLLTRNTEREADRITSIRIAFPQGESNLNPLCNAGGSWWDTDKDRPRESSIHGISDIELALRPFAWLSRVHRVDIQLPDQVDRHVRSDKFVKSLQHCMTAKTLQNNFNSDDLERKIEGARFALEDHIRNMLYGGTRTNVAKITDEELEQDRMDPQSDSDDDMQSIQGDDNFEKEQGGNKYVNLEAAKLLIERTEFDEDGGFLNDHDSLDGNEPVTPNEKSEKVAAFVECFGVTGDIARLYLELCNDELEPAVQLYIAMPDASRAVAAHKPPPVDEGPVTPDHKRGGSPQPGGGSGKQKDREEAKEWKKNNKGKGRAMSVSSDDEDLLGEYGRDGETLFGGVLSQTARTRRLQNKTRDEHDAQKSDTLGHRTLRGVFSRGRREGSMTSQSHGPNTSSTTHGWFDSTRDHLPANSGPRRTRSTLTTFNDTHDAFGPPQTIVRRDSSAGLAATVSRQGGQTTPTRVSDYRLYSSPAAPIRTTSAQAAAHMSEDLVFGRRTTQQANRHTAYSNSSSRQSAPGQRSFVLPSSGISETRAGQQSLQSFVSHDELAGSLQYAQTAYRNSAYRNSLPNGPSQSTIASTENNDNAMICEHIENVGGSYYTDSNNVTSPIAAPYPSSDVSAPAPNQALAGSSAPFSQSTGRFAPTAPISNQDSNGEVASQYHTPTGPDTNNVATSTLRHSGLSAGVEDMDVDDDADGHSPANA
jgi:hypothetical protein